MSPTVRNLFIYGVLLCCCSERCYEFVEVVGIGPFEEYVFAGELSGGGFGVGCLEEELEVWESVFELEEFGADEYGGVESVDGGEPVEDVEVLGVFLGPEFSHGSEYDAFGVVGPVLEVVDGSVHAAGVGVVGVDDEVVPAGL